MAAPHANEAGRGWLGAVRITPGAGPFVLSGWDALPGGVALGPARASEWLRGARRREHGRSSRTALSVGDPRLQYDSGGPRDRRAEDRRVSGLRRPPGLSPSARVRAARRSLPGRVASVSVSVSGPGRGAGRPGGRQARQGRGLAGSSRVPGDARRCPQDGHGGRCPAGGAQQSPESAQPHRRGVRGGQAAQRVSVPSRPLGPPRCHLPAVPTPLPPGGAGEPARVPCAHAALSAREQRPR